MPPIMTEQEINHLIQHEWRNLSNHYKDEIKPEFMKYLKMIFADLLAKENGFSRDHFVEPDVFQKVRF